MDKAGSSNVDLFSRGFESLWGFFSASGTCISSLHMVVLRVHLLTAATSTTFSRYGGGIHLDPLIRLCNILIYVRISSVRIGVIEDQLLLEQTCLIDIKYVSDHLVFPDVNHIIQY